MTAYQTYPVTHLVATFRQALVAMVPVAEAVGLTWRDGEAYDEWDSIEEFLFDTIVACTVAGDVDLFGESCPFFTYRFQPSSYEKHSWIEVDLPDHPEPHALGWFGSADSFGELTAVPLDDARTKPAGEPVTVPWSTDLRFTAHLRAPDGSLTAAAQVTPTESVTSKVPLQRSSTGPAAPFTLRQEARFRWLRLSLRLQGRVVVR